MKKYFLHSILFFAAILIGQNSLTAQADPFANQPTPDLTNFFFAKWTVTPTHAPMDGATGLGQTAAAEQAFGNMGILVRFNAGGTIDVRNGTDYEAMATMNYAADTTYTIAVRANVQTQTYSVDVTPAGDTTTRLATDYAFRLSTPQDTLRNLSMVINELAQFGGVPGSRLNPSFIRDTITGDSIYELNIANNQNFRDYEGKFKVSFDMMPTAQAIDAVFGFSNGAIPVQGYGGMSAILRCNQAGKIDARDGTGYNAENDIFYVAGTVYSVEMTFDVAAQSYTVTVQEGGVGEKILIGENYGFRAAADTINNVAKLIGTGGLFGGKPGDLVMSNFVFGDSYANTQTQAMTNLFYARWTVQPTHAPMDGATGFGKTEATAQAFGNMGILVRFNSSGNIDVRNGTSYEALADMAYAADSVYTIEVRADVKTQTYSVDVTNSDTTMTLATDYTFRMNNPQDTLNYFSMVINELEQFGGVPGSRLNPSFAVDPNSRSNFELNMANNDDIPMQDGTFKMTFDMTPTAQAIDAAIGITNGVIVPQGYSGMSAILRCNQGGKIDARDGTGYNAENDLFYVAGTTYSVTMLFDVKTQSYNVSVKPAGEAAVVIAENYKFRAAADTLNNMAKLIGTNGQFGGQPGDLVVTKVAFGDPFSNQNTPALTNFFFAKWGVTPTHSPMDGATGLGKTAVTAQAFGNMGILVRFNNDGFIDVRNGSTYGALVDMPYEANKEYVIAVKADVKAQTYSVDVNNGDSTVTLATDYVFRTNNPQDTLNYLSMVINELPQFGGLPGSRLNPSFITDSLEKADLELNLANNDDMDEQSDKFTVSFNMTPTKQAIDGVVAFSNGAIPVQGYGGMSAILRCNQGGKVDARDGTGYNAENDLFYVAGTKYEVEMTFDVVAQTYSAVVTPEGGSTVVIATDYGFRAAADTLNNIAKLVGIGGMFGGQPGDLVATDFVFTSTGVYDINAPEFNMYPNPVLNELYVTFAEEVEYVEVFDNLGRKLMSSKIQGATETSLNVSELPTGIYLLNVSSAKGSGSKLFVKQ